ncbi:MAG: PEGA domain-containing protein [Polyangiaceae bacterium]
MSLRRSRQCAAAFLLTTILAPQSAFAQSPEVPECNGNDPAAATRLEREGRDHYRLAMRGSEINQSEMSAALKSFEGECGAGNSSALEFRAYALAGLQRYVEAANTLDAFTRAHPLASLPQNVQSRVIAQQAEIFGQVATLSVACSVSGAQIKIDGKSAGTAPIGDLRLQPGKVEIEVSAAGYKSVKRTVQLSVGTARAEPFDLDRDADAAPPTDVTPPPTVVVPPPAEKPKHANLTPWIIGFGIAGGVGLGVGVGGIFWSARQANAYNDPTQDCPHHQTNQSCVNTLDEYNTAHVVELTGLIAGGALAATAIGIGIYAVVRKDPDPKATAKAHAACVPTFTTLGFSCGGTF